MEVKCKNCLFFETVVQAGELFTFINPHGDEVNREHSSNIHICRANPPIGGDWPQVTEDDWCGMFKENEKL